MIENSSKIGGNLILEFGGLLNCALIKFEALLAHLLKSYAFDKGSVPAISKAESICTFSNLYLLVGEEIFGSGFIKFLRDIVWVTIFKVLFGAGLLPI